MLVTTVIAAAVSRCAVRRRSGDDALVLYTSGSTSYNQSLSERRAASVNNYLISRGISSSRLSMKGYGEESPKYTNESEDGRMQNRNVQFLISANEKMKEAARKEAGTSN